MARVNVITSITDPKCPAKIQRVGIWIIEVVENSFPVTSQGMLVREAITGQELTLQLLANALTKAKQLNKEIESIEMYFNCEVVEERILNKWLEKWNDNEWKNAKGKDIADKDTWMLIWNLLIGLGNRYIVSQKQSSYELWMQSELRKQMEKIKDKAAAEESVKKIQEMLS